MTDPLLTKQLVGCNKLGKLPTNVGISSIAHVFFCFFRKMDAAFLRIVFSLFFKDHQKIREAQTMSNTYFLHECFFFSNRFLMVFSNFQARLAKPGFSGSEVTNQGGAPENAEVQRYYFG